MKIRSTILRLSVLLGLLVWLGLGTYEEAAARAGGAGGGSSSSGNSGGSSGERSSGSSGSGFGSSSGGSSSGGSGSGYSGSLSGGSSDDSPESDALLTFIFGLGGGGLIFAVVSIWWLERARAHESDPQPELPQPPTGKLDGLQTFLVAHPDFDAVAFGDKVRSAFVKIQEAWTEQDISRIRPFISDGMYQRFATQFRMMGLLKQRNLLNEIQIHGVQPVAFRIDGVFDVIDVWISATMSDSFTCELDASMDSEGNDPFIEYWSFIRKRGARNTSFDSVAAHTCPGCGARLPEDMGELCRCTHCQVIVNSGEFDWVLAEITQEADYGWQSTMRAHVSQKISKEITVVTRKCPDFSRQLAEDKASNAFMQIMTALATRNPALIRRFVDDEAFGEISAMIPERKIVFNRIYLNESVLLEVGRENGVHWFEVGLIASLQRVELLPEGLIIVDREEQRLEFFLTMERDVKAVPQKGSLYQHQCANCGGAVGDTLDIACQYCGTALNSTRHEWIVCGFEAN